MNYQSNRPDIAQAGPVQWLAIGIQPQWGFTVFDPAYYKNVNFTLPLSVNGTFCAFSTGYDAKGSTFLWHSMSHFNNVNVGVTGFVFDSRYTFTGLGYLAVCWQKQWGYLQKQAEKWIYPIPVLEAFIATKTCISNNHSAAGYVGYWTWDKDITTEYAYSWNNYPSYCFMIGKVQQQWGYQTVHGTNPVTYDLPIPFEEAPFTVAISTGNSGNHASCGGFTKTTIVLRAGTTAGVWDTVGFFIIGCQLQWGTAGGSATFAVPFTNVLNIVCASNNSENINCQVTSINNNGFSTNRSYQCKWLAIGI